MAGKRKQRSQKKKKAVAPTDRKLLRKLTCVDLFAGAGGFSLAAQNVGLTVVAAVEFNPKACETYTHNLVKDGVPHLYAGDIKELDPVAVQKVHFADHGCDLLLGGPPCQGFSVHRIKGAGVDDPRNDLILHYFQFVATLRPRVFLMENVPGILWERHKPFLDEFYSRGRLAGYDLHDPIVIDAKDYGVPQRRKRVFVLGVRMDVAAQFTWPPAPTHSGDAEVTQNRHLKPWRTANDVFSKAIKRSDPNNIHMQHTAEIIEVFRNTPLNGGSRAQSGRILDCHTEHNGHKDVYGRIDMRLPGPTMTTACINPSKGRFVHPIEHHGISVRHAARFQTFPDSFEFLGGLTAAGMQIGNAVPVKLGEVLIREIQSALRAYDAEEGQQ
ncbi:DNA cytosine methyltransferase [Massilia sp. SM-13]|uniref:DNA cytosine methyltransferase n=1 Tax=Pseudoduganella rhizocola TaxID=3382643 RepID=UPI0038B67C3B